MFLGFRASFSILNILILILSGSQRFGHVFFLKTRFGLSYIRELSVVTRTIGLAANRS